MPGSASTSTCLVGGRRAVDAVAQVDDRAAARVAQHALHDVGGGLVRSVARGDVPHRHAHAVPVHDAGHERRAVAVRRPEPRRARADLLLERQLRPFELRVARVEPAPLVVVVRVVGDQVTVAVRACGRCSGCGVERLTDDEERRVHVRGVEDVHDLRRGVGVGLVVEGDRDLAAVARAVVDAAAEPLGRHGAGAEVRRHPERDDRERGAERDRARRAGPGAVDRATERGRPAAPTTPSTPSDEQRVAVVQRGEDDQEDRGRRRARTDGAGESPARRARRRR